MPFDLDNLKYCRNCGLAIGMKGGCTCNKDKVTVCPECGNQVSVDEFDKEAGCCFDCYYDHE